MTVQYTCQPNIYLYSYVGPVSICCNTHLLYEAMQNESAEQFFIFPNARSVL